MSEKCQYYQSLIQESQNQRDITESKSFEENQNLKDHISQLQAKYDEEVQKVSDLKSTVGFFFFLNFLFICILIFFC